MAITALHSAATGLGALSTRIDVIANNLANAETQGFKRSRLNFEDLMYLTLQQPGAQNSGGGKAPAGLQVGLGVKTSNTQLDFSQGPMMTTNDKTDVAIEGPGFFRVTLPPEQGGGVGYTRSGNFFVNNAGQLVIGARDGPLLIPPIEIPAGSTDIRIGESGEVQVSTVGDSAFQTAGIIQLAVFPNLQGLKAIGGNIYIPTDASGQAVTGAPLTNGTGRLLQGVLEGSNVDPVRELITLIKTQRSFELNSQSIQTADQALQTIANLRRF